MKRVRRVKAGLRADRVPADLLGSVRVAGDVRAAVVATVAAVAIADAAAKVAAGGIAFLTRIIANPHGSRASRAGSTLFRCRLTIMPP